jgi:putative endonuclease
MQSQNNHYFVYIVSEQQGANIQIGIANNLQAHLLQEFNGSKVINQESPKLVYYEHYDQKEIALNRERQIKENSQDATYNLVASMNPNWLDLRDTLED